MSIISSELNIIEEFPDIPKRHCEKCGRKLYEIDRKSKIDYYDKITGEPVYNIELLLSCEKWFHRSIHYSLIKDNGKWTWAEYAISFYP